MFDPSTVECTVDVLAQLAGPAAALELAIGTGRVALPLAARGVQVAAIELSEAMVQQLRAKPGGAQLQVVIGDMASARVPGFFGLVYLVFNTIGNLTTQEQQIACFANAAAHLEVGGSFVVEVGVPELRRLPPRSATSCLTPMAIAGGSTSTTPHHSGLSPIIYATTGRDCAIERSHFAMSGRPSWI